MDRKTNTLRLHGCFLILCTLCLILVAFWQIGAISTHKLELEVFNEFMNWNFEDILDYINAPYPEWATDIRYKSSRFDRTFFIELRFKAPPESAMRFALSVCNGVLHKGYNPFDAVDISHPVEDQKHVLVYNSAIAYFSYSPNATSYQIGNRCQPQREWRTQYILVDTSNPNLYEVRFEIPDNGTEQTYAPLMFESPPPRATNIHPIADFPFMVVGIVEQNDRYLLVTDEICFETRWDYRIDAPFIYKTYQNPTYGIYPDNFIGAQIQIYVDEELVIGTSISERWTLDHPRQDDVPYQDLLFNYCIFRHWDAGTHKMDVEVTSRDGVHTSYSWDVYADS